MADAGPSAPGLIEPSGGDGALGITRVTLPEVEREPGYRNLTTRVGPGQLQSQGIEGWSGADTVHGAGRQGGQGAVVMAQFDTEYQRLEASYSDSPPGEEDLLVHVPEGSKSPWHHIENLDLFFSRVYNLHQKNGFTCMLIGEIFELMQFLFVVAFTTFLVSCVDYDILFANKMVNHSLHPTEPVKVTLPDAFLPAQVCSARIQENGSLITILVIAGVFWVHRLIKFIYNICCYWEIHSFYLHALRIPMSALPYCTWQEVQARIVQTQKEHQICIHKRELTELDIYHRILRFQNYMVALVNKSLLPLRFRLPGLGEVVFFTRGLKYNFELILFWGPGSLFLNEWSLKAEYKRGGQRLELAQRLSNRILWIGIANFLLCPLILIWQILYAFFSYAEVLKREPGALGARCWSLYGRCYLRHFNELEHELQSRLNRGYKPASKYMNCFLSPLLTLLAKNCAFFAGSILAVLIALTIYDEDVLAVEHVLTTVTLLGVTVTVCRSFIPDQHMVFCPEQLLRVILAHIHYMPDHWQGVHPGGVTEPHCHTSHPHLLSAPTGPGDYRLLPQFHRGSCRCWRHLLLRSDGCSPAWASPVAVRWADGGLSVPAGRGWEDRVVTHALCHHQPWLAATT